MSYVEAEISGTTAWITLNRPEKLNAFTLEMYEALRFKIEEFGTDQELHAVVIRGAGRALSSGFDRNAPVEDLSEALQLTNACRWAIWDCPIPVVIAAHGYCLGGAFELTYPADLVIATDTCRFGVPEVKDGVSAGFNMLPWLANHKIVKAWMLTGELRSATEALAAGLVTHIASENEFVSQTNDLTERLGSVPRHTLVAVKAATNRVPEHLNMRGIIDGEVVTHAGKGLFDGSQP